MIEIGGLMGMYEKKNREGDEEAKPHGRWKGEGIKKKTEREMRGQNLMGDEGAKERES